MIAGIFLGVQSGWKIPRYTARIGHYRVVINNWSLKQIGLLCVNGAEVFIFLSCKGKL